MELGAPTRRWPVVGVEDEVEALLAALADRDVGGVVLSGPAGIGKTALAGEVASRAARAGVPVVRVVATPAASSVPFGCLGPLLVHAGLGVDTPQLPVALARALRQAGATGPARPVLVIDDLPLLDHPSSAALADLVRADTIFLLATARSTVPLTPEVHGLVVEDRLVVRPVGPCAPAALVAAAEAWLGGPLAPDAVTTLVGRAGGLPLHVRELVRTGAQTGVLAHDGGAWRLVGPLVAPPGLVELVASRFAPLGPTERRRLTALALAEPLPLPAATALVGTDALASFEQADVVTVRDGGDGPAVTLGHPLYADALRAHQRRAELAAAAELATGALDGLGDEEAARRATTLRVDHGLAVTADRAVRAALQALSLGDPLLALRLIDAGGGDDHESWLVRGAALSAAGEVEVADDALAAAVARAGDDAQRARAISRRANNLSTGGGRFDAAEVVLRDGLDRVSDPSWRSFVAADLAYVRLWKGDRDHGATGPVGEGPDAVRANECLVGAVVAVMGGELARAEALVVEGLPLAPALRDVVPTARELMTLSRFLARAWAGDARGADAVVASELERAATGPAGAPGTWLAVRSVQRLIDGRPEAAAADAAEAERCLDLVDVSGLRPLAVAVRATALARLGRVAESERAEASIDAVWADEVKVKATLAQARAWRLVAVGQHRAAARTVVEAGAEALAANHVPFGAIAAHDAVRLGHPVAALPVLREAVQRWEGPLAAALVDQAEALVDGDAERLLTVARRLPECGFTLAGAEAAAQAARAFAAEGRTREAHHAEQVAASTAAPLGPVTSPALGRPRGLTEREEEVARQAAAGAASADIALALGLSRRTVDNHLASVYRKLGIGGRRDLAGALAGVGIAQASSADCS